MTVTDWPDISGAFRACLEELDVEGMRQFTEIYERHLPVPTDEQILVMMHHARTGAKSIRFILRAYSHAWLTERGLPSALPDHMRPRAHRMYPVTVTAVGIAVVALSRSTEALAKETQKAQEEAVLECYANGTTDPEFIKARMAEARERVYAAD